MLAIHLLIVLLSFRGTRTQANDRQALITNLLANYNNNFRPNPSSVLTLTLSFSLKQINSIDETNLILYSNVFINHRWIDDRLKWTPSSNGNIQSIYMALSQIWLPDIYVLNSASSSGFLTYNPTSAAKVTSDGTVSIDLPIIGLATQCSLNTRTFPFDSQQCPIFFTVWSYEQSEIVLNVAQNGTIDTANYLSNQIWTLNSNTIITKNGSSSTIQSYNYGNFKNDIVGFEVYITRKPLYYMVLAILPCLVLNIMSLYSFFMDFSDQIALTITAFLSFAVTVVQIADNIPVQSDYVPMITSYFTASCLYSLISMLWFILYNWFDNKKFLPSALTAISDFFMMIYDRIDCKRNQIDDKSEKAIKKPSKKKTFERQLTTINLFAFFIFFLIMLISLLVIWLSIYF